MIEREFVSRNMNEFRIKEFIVKSLSRVGLSDVKVQRTPLGEKIVIRAARPGLVVGRAGANISKLTKDLKAKFKLENPQIEIDEIKDLHLDAAVVAENIAAFLERFGSQRFKSIGHRSMENVMTAGALGVEILITGKIPSSRARRWRFYTGYLKKCGDVALHGVDHFYSQASLKTGVVGIKVSIMPPTTQLPDHVEFLSTPEEVVEELPVEEEKPEEKKTVKKNAAPKKKAAKKEEKPEVKEEPKKEVETPKVEEAPKEELPPVEKAPEPVSEEGKE